VGPVGGLDTVTKRTVPACAHNGTPIARHVFWFEFSPIVLIRTANFEKLSCGRRRELGDESLQDPKSAI
jgi:hypothetical protein